MDQQLSFHLDQNEVCIWVYVGSQDKVTIQIIEYPFTDLIQLASKMHFLVFLDHEHIFGGHLELHRFCFFFLLKEILNMIQVSSHFLDWL